MANAIIQAIESGFSVLESLATNFLTAFTTLFWDATANNGAGALTTFGNYSLIMLSISICFAVLMLAFSVLRSNTGV